MCLLLWLPDAMIVVPVESIRAEIRVADFILLAIWFWFETGGFCFLRQSCRTNQDGSLLSLEIELVQSTGSDVVHDSCIYRSLSGWRYLHVLRILVISSRLHGIPSLYCMSRDSLYFVWFYGKYVICCPSSFEKFSRIPTDRLQALGSRKHRKKLVVKNFKNIIVLLETGLLKCISYGWWFNIISLI